MANFTAADVKKLRDMTGAGMMDCKKALDESEGDFEKAVELLRIKGAKDVGKRADRTAGQGLVAAAGSALIELACETDFVAKNSEFQELADKVVAVVAEDPTVTDVDTALAAQVADGTVGDAIQALSAKIGVLVQYAGDDGEVARNAAMQVASLKARFVTRADVPADVLETERRIAEATAREEGKPEGALPKIVEGRINGFYKDAVLVEQSSVLDSKKTVGTLLDEAGVTVTAFSRFEVGQS
jgi:elongation factor Ts